LLSAGAERVTGVDRDPAVFEMAAEWSDEYGQRLVLVEGTFSDLDQYVDAPLDGVVLDLGVSSMQLDQAERGFSFMGNGPLDMRMSQSGTSASDIVAEAEEELLADILYHYGEERASRRIARAIVGLRGRLWPRARRRRSQRRPPLLRLSSAVCRARSRGIAIQRRGRSKPCVSR
jgi:16S rRNA (cytosine1402-N4)-methyltransferase